MVSVKNFITGNISRKILLTRLIPLMFLILYGTVFIAGMIYPSAFDWRVLVMSELSNPQGNPAGFFYPSVGMTVVGVMMIPVLGYFHKRLNKICKGTTITGSIFFIVGIFGMIAISIFMDPIGPIIFGIDNVHSYFAVLATLGMLLAFFFYGFSLLKDRKSGKRQFNQPLLIAGAIMLWSLFLGLVISQGILMFVDPGWGTPGLDWLDGSILPKPPLFFSLALWEWPAIIGIFVYVVLLAIMIPEDVEATPRRKKEVKVEV
ncbi:MAG: DUF998 domain-containing protein [Candidatus Hodarchaeota archaeon]